jgi:S-adenosylmethionine-dependent methyltransferase
MGAETVRSRGLARGGVVWSVLGAELDRRAAADADGLDVLDLGGGSGVSAVPLAELGHRVTVLDVSADALATLHRRAEEAGVAERVTPLQGEVERLPAAVSPGSYDLVLCHGLLEVVDSPAETLAAVAGALRLGGCASVLAAGRAAAVLARALGGRLADAIRLAADPDGRSGPADPMLRRFDAPALGQLVAGAGLRVEAVHGVGVVADLVPGAVLEGQPGAAESLRELEAAVAGRSPYRDVAAQLHVLARR